MKISLLGWLRCRIGGHMRGVLDKAASTPSVRVYRCPRCGTTWTRKGKP